LSGCSVNKKITIELCYWSKTRYFDFYRYSIIEPSAFFQRNSYKSRILSNSKRRI